MNRSARRVFASVLITSAITCGAPLAGCTSDTGPTLWYLGGLDAAAPEVTEQPDSTAPPTVGTLTAHACTSPLLQGADELTLVRQAAASQSRLILTTTDGVDGWQIDDQGCPSAKINSFGVQGHVAIDALSAGPLPANRALVASATKTVVLDSTGAVVGTCSNGGSEVKARYVDLTADGRAIGLVVRSPVELIQTNIDTPLCTSSKQELAPAAFAVLAIAHGHNGSGWVAVEQETGHSAIGISRYDATGVRAQSVSWPDALDPGHLCSASGVVETERGIVVADGACKRVVVYDAATLQPTWQAKLQDTPRGVAYGGVGDQVLVPITRTVVDGAQASFVVLTLQ